jgi:CHAD domain-containing protein
MRVATEREIKLEAPPGYVLPDLEGEPLERRVFSSTYYDAPGGSLARAGITLRRRVENGAALWQLKLPAADGRLEIEEPGGPVGPPDSIGRLLVAHVRHGPVEPVAELRTIRTGVIVESGRAEVVLDKVTVMDGNRAAGVFTEIEVELREGDPEGLDAIARRLRRSGARKGDGKPKLMRVLGPRPDEAENPDPVRARLREQLGEMLAHDPGTRLGADPEDLHDFRVAVRRLRALLRTARGSVDGDRSEPLRAELKWLGTILGAVRDLDVIIDHLRGEIARLDEAERSAADGLLGALGQERSRARRAMLTALGGRRYLALLDSLERAAVELPVDSKSLDLPTLARDEFRKLRRHAKAIDSEPADEQLHDLRKRGKRARYAAELAGDGRRSRDFVGNAKQLQDVLGEHQDAAVLEERLRKMLDPDATAARGLVVGRLIERESERRHGARAEWERAWRRLERSGRRAFP